jgi:hypothetical protein
LHRIQLWKGPHFLDTAKTVWNTCLLSFLHWKYISVPCYFPIFVPCILAPCWLFLCSTVPRTLNPCFLHIRTLHACYILFFSWTLVSCVTNLKNILELEEWTNRNTCKEFKQWTNRKLPGPYRCLSNKCYLSLMFSQKPRGKWQWRNHHRSI